ncbi:MAG TPA: hypothetical protein EYH56_00065 [Nanoarchaeota archaeon]|nr:hypothetical protein [Nanoarchaeota archaeon]
MPILDELRKTVQDDIVDGVIETIIDTDDLFKVLPFRKVNGGALHVTWEDTIPTANFIAPDGTIPQSPGTTLVPFKDGIKVIAQDIDIPNFSTEVEGADANIMLYGEIKAIARTYKKNVVVGDETTNPLTFNGLDKQIARAETQGLQRTIDAAATPLTFEMLDELLTLMKMGADVIIMHSKTYNEYKKLLRQAGGTDSAMLQLPNFGKAMLTYDGVPIIKNDNIPITTDANGNILSTIYAGVLDENEGITGLYAGNNAGIQYKYLGEAQDKDAARYRFKWYCGFTVMNPYAVGAIKNVKIG